jgi:hypothetical protein
VELKNIGPTILKSGIFSLKIAKRGPFLTASGSAKLVLLILAVMHSFKGNKP